MNLIVNSALTVDAASSITIQDHDSILDVAGTLTIEGEVTVTHASIDTNDYDLVVASGPPPGVLNLVGANAVIDVGTGLLDVQGVLNAGPYSGGTAPDIIGDMEVSGTVVFDDTEPELTVNGDYTQTADGGLEMPVSALLHVTGTATLNGSLTVGLGNVDEPEGSSPDSWTVLQYNSRSGTFASATPPTTSEGGFGQPAYGSTSATLTWWPAPTVGGISPTSGPAAGGTTITIGGTNLTATTAVTFGSTAASSFTIVSATQITATAPAHSAGTVDITVTTPGGVSGTSSSDQYTYIAAPTVTGVSPAAGPTGGGTVLTITGTNFTGATQLKFGSDAAPGFTVNSATQITVTTTSHSAGTVDITVTTAGGTSATSSSDQYTFVTAPTVTALSPTAGSTAGGTTVTITGTDLTGASSVKFGTTNASSFTVVNSTTITATSPALSSGAHYVTVTTAGGASATGSANQFTYVAPPAVTGVSPNMGPTWAGMSVTITGTDLSNATSVKFGTTSASINSNSSTQIIATAPAHAAGTVDITVTTAYGTSSTSSSDHYTYMSFLTFDGEAVEPPEDVEALTMDQVNPILTEAAQRWIVAAAAAGADSDGIAELLAGVEVRIVDLPGNLLAGTAGNVVWIDQNAAGHGWFVDATPGNDSEFATIHSAYELWAGQGSSAAGRVDLLTVLSHELGHVLGFDHGEEHELMEATLDLGVRLLPEYHQPEWSFGDLVEHWEPPADLWTNEALLEAMHDRWFPV